MRMLALAILLLAAPAAPADAGVARAQFTTAVIDREPVDAVETAFVRDGRIRFFTELSGLTGRTVTHRWEFGGRVMAEVPIEVGADRWRAWSSKRLLPAWTGEWRVSVVADDGSVLGTWSLRVE